MRWGEGLVVWAACCAAWVCSVGVRPAPTLRHPVPATPAACSKSKGKRAAPKRQKLADGTAAAAGLLEEDKSETPEAVDGNGEEVEEGDSEEAEEDGETESEAPAAAGAAGMGGAVLGMQMPCMRLAGATLARARNREPGGA